jgi:DNA mismatch repair protein MutL
MRRRDFVVSPEREPQNASMKPVTEGRARIQRLSERVQNQIAAGEVVERPASVVKELVENAIDAGATRIQVDLEEGGARMVRVSDDGGGMAREDLELAFVSHATSKLFEVADLEHIASLGFRGEALASIGAVSRCRIFSRESAAPTGWSIENSGGAIGSPQEAGGPIGTVVEARELFFNVPARRHFQKRTSTELSHALDVIQRVALAHTGVGFVATHDGRRIFDVEATMNLRARIRRAFGAELADALVAVEARDGDVVLGGFVAPPRLARSDSSRQMWFLNGRSLKDRVLIRALKEGYRGFMLDGRQPVAFLELRMDPARVDVNVHPAKSEVRFRDERRLFGFIVNTLRAALAGSDLATPGARLIETAERRELAARHEATLYPRGPFDTGGVAREAREPFAVFDVASDHAARAPLTTSSPAPAAAPAVTAGPSSGPFLQVARTYLVRPLLDGFEVVDQHALHERITYEGLVADMRGGRVEVQRYLVPELVELSRAEVALVAGQAELLKRVGVEVAEFSETTLAVHGLPARLSRPNVRALVDDLVALLDDARAPSAEILLESVLHSAACRSSVMAGDALSTEEIRSLFERGAQLESDQTCVHGRPTRVRFTLADLEKAFQRR